MTQYNDGKSNFQAVHFSSIELKYASVKTDFTLIKCTKFIY